MGAGLYIIYCTEQAAKETSWHVHVIMQLLQGRLHQCICSLHTKRVHNYPADNDGGYSTLKDDNITTFSSSKNVENTETVEETTNKML